MEENILLVDDEEGIRKVLGISLMDLGYQVFTAADGEEALSVFRKHQPPIVLTDIKMPRMDGIDLLQQIKAESPDTEVIMLTGHGDMELAIKCLKLEATDFITKPINDDVLEIALKRAHDRIGMRTQLRVYTENLETMVQEQAARLINNERQAAVGQAMEGLSTVLRDIAGDLNTGINYFNELPCFVSIHNRNREIIAVNSLYRERLGDHVGQATGAAYAEDAAAESPVIETFVTGDGKRCRARLPMPTEPGDRSWSTRLPFETAMEKSNWWSKSAPTSGRSGVSRNDSRPPNSATGNCSTKPPATSPCKRRT